MSPADDTVWYTGEEFRVEWETNVIVNTVRLVFWEMSGLWYRSNYAFDEIVDNNGYYDISLPENISLGETWMIEMLIGGVNDSVNDMVLNIRIRIRSPVDIVDKVDVDYTIWIMSLGLAVLGMFSILLHLIRQNYNVKREIEKLKHNR